MTDTCRAGSGTEVLHGHFHEPGNARRADAPTGGSEAIARLGRVRSTQSIRWISAPLGQVAQRLAQFGRVVPLPRTEVGDQVDDSLRTVIVAQQSADRLQGGQRPGVGLRDFDFGQNAAVCR